MTECKKHGKMFEKMVKCQQSGFWAENVLIKAIENWIQTKYSYSPSVRLLEYNFVSVMFSDDKKMEEYDKIMEDVCNEFHLEIKYCKHCCVRRFDEDGYKHRKHIEYELHSRSDD